MTDAKPNASSYARAAHITLVRWRTRNAKKDILTADAFAWVLYKKGNFAEAKKASVEAIK